MDPEEPQAAAAAGRDAGDQDDDGRDVAGAAGRGAGGPGPIDTGAEAYTERRVVRVSATSAIVGVAMIVLALMAQRVFVAAHRPLSWALAAAIVAVLIDPLVSVLGRHIPRVVAVLGALLVVGLASFGVVYRAFDDLSNGLDRLGEAAQDAAVEIESRDDGVGDLAQDVDASRRVDDFVEAVEDRVTGGEDVLVSTAGTAPTYFIGAILTVFLMSYGPRLATSALRQVPGEGRRRRVATIGGRALVRGRRAVLFTLGEGLIAGLAVGLTAAALGLPAPSALGLAAGLMALLPHVGLVLGALPFLLLMLGLRSDAATIALAVGVVIVQLIDSLVVRPWIADRSVHIGLLVPWVVALVGYTVYGVGGAAYSLAIAAFALAAVDEIQRRVEQAPAAGEAGEPDGPGPDGPDAGGSDAGGSDGPDGPDGEPGDVAPAVAKV
jgi:putative heme transporter